MGQNGSTIDKIIDEILKSSSTLPFDINRYLGLEERKCRIERLTLVHSSQVIRSTIEFLFTVHVTVILFPSTLSSQQFWVYAGDSWMAQYCNQFYLVVWLLWAVNGQLPDTTRANVHMFLTFIKSSWMWPHPGSLFFFFYVVILGLWFFSFILLSDPPHNHSLTEPWVNMRNLREKTR